MTLKYLSEFTLLLWVVFGIGEKYHHTLERSFTTYIGTAHKCVFKQYSNAHTATLSTNSSWGKLPVNKVLPIFWLTTKIKAIL